MSGAAGLSAAKRRRGTSQAGNNDMENDVNDNQNTKPIHPFVQISIHENKLNALRHHITELGKGFMEHRDEVALAIPQLQEAVEELLKAAQTEKSLDNTIDIDSKITPIIMSVNEDLTNKIINESNERAKLEMVISDLQMRLSETESIIQTLTQNTSNLSASEDPQFTFPNNSETELVKEDGSTLVDQNIRLTTIEE